MAEYNYVSVDIRKEIANQVEAEYDGELTIRDVVLWLWDNGLIDKKGARNALIKEFFTTQLKTQNVTESVLDCSVNFDISIDSVKKIVYNYTH